MSLPNYKKYPGFKITYFIPDPGILEFAKVSIPHPVNLEVETFLNYKQAIDSTHCKEVEIIDVKPGAKIILPCSKDGVCAKISYVGPEPKFEGLDKNRNLEARIPANCCVRVEFRGVFGSKHSHVKYFRTTL